MFCPSLALAIRKGKTAHMHLTTRKLNVRSIEQLTDLFARDIGIKLKTQFARRKFITFLFSKLIYTGKPTNVDSTTSIAV